MKKYSGSILIFVVLTQITAILIIGKQYITKKQQSNVLGAYAVSPIKKSDLVFPEVLSLHRYYELKPNTKVEQVAPWNTSAIHTINADGLNERYDYTPVTPKNTYRIVTLGDSMTEGQWVDTDKNFSETLEDMLRASMKCANIDNFEVINLGVGGYDMEYMTTRYWLKGQKYTPDLLIVFISESDFTERNEDLFPIMDRINYSSEAATIISQTDSPHAVYNKAYELYIHSPTYSKNDTMRYQLNQLKNLLSMHHKSTILYSFDSNPSELSQSIDSLIHGMDDVQYWPIIHTYDALPDGHESEKGHKQLAEQLFSHLKTSGIIPCQ
jgi:lysophospholipase L1-like esterase